MPRLRTFNNRRKQRFWKVLARLKLERGLPRTLGELPPELRVRIRSEYWTAWTDALRTAGVGRHHFRGGGWKVPPKSGFARKLSRTASVAASAAT
jgi:hypothetical protein